MPEKILFKVTTVAFFDMLLTRILLGFFPKIEIMQIINKSPFLESDFCSKNFKKKSKIFFTARACTWREATAPEAE